MINILIKVLDNGKIPSKMRTNDAGYDCYANEDVAIKPLECKAVKLGFAMKIHYGYYGQLCGRSGMAFNNGILAHIGTIDSDYTGEVKVLLFNTTDTPYIVKRGDRVAQLIIQPVPNTVLSAVERLPDTERNDNGFGSSGK